MRLLVLCIVLAVRSKGLTFQIQVNRKNTTRTEFCIGESLSFICTIPTTSGFLWTAPPYVQNTAGVVSQQLPMATSGAITMRYHGSKHSTLDVIAFSGLNGTTVTCQDVAQNSQQSVSRLVKLTASPSRPLLRSRQRDDFNSIIITIINYSPCITEYQLSIVDSNSRVYQGSISESQVSSDNEVDVMDVISNIRINLCTQMYTIVVTSNYYNVIESSRSHILRVLYGGLGRLSNFVLKGNTLTWKVPDKLDGCVINYLYMTWPGNRTGLLNSNANSALLSQFKVGLPCTNVVLKLSPVVRVQNQQVEDSSMQLQICEKIPSTSTSQLGQTIPMTEESTVSTGLIPSMPPLHSIVVLVVSTVASELL